MSKTVEPIPSGFGEISKRRAGGLARKRKSEDGAKSVVETAEMIGRVFADRSQRAQALADAVPEIRKAKPATSQSRRAVAPRKGRRGNASGRVEFVGPTPERLAKGDIVYTKGACVAEDGLERLRRGYRQPTEAPELKKAEEVLARLHRGCRLDNDPGMNERMYEAGKKYERLVHLAGLGGIGAQNLLAARGEGNAPHMMPASEAAASARMQLRKAWALLSAKLGAVLHSLLIDGRDAAEIGREVSTYQSRSECTTAALTALRIALYSLVEARWA